MPSDTRVSVIICCYTLDRLPDITAVVRSVLAQRRLPDEIIMCVDNNPALFERLQQLIPPTISLHLNSNIRGLSETRNVAVRAATGQILAFIDDDAEATPDWLDRLVLPFRDAKVLAAGGQAIPVWPGGHPPIWFPSEYDFIIGCTGHNELMLQEDGEIRNVTGSNMAFRREVFDKVGFWRTELGRGQTVTGGEEAELCLRIKSKFPDAKIQYEPSSIVYHKVAQHRATLRYVLPYAFHEGIVRAKLRKFALSYTNKPLAGEQLFLRRLLLKALPQHAARFYQLSSFLQACMIILNTLLVGMGYVVGRLRYR